MKTLALIALLALPLAAQTTEFKAADDPVTTISGDPKDLTPNEQIAYMLIVIQDLSATNNYLNRLLTRALGVTDVQARDQAHAERLAALKDLAKKHNACEGGDWDIAKKEWACPAK